MASSTWASIMVIINFIFGILVFKEPVANVWGTLCSILLLIVGLVGMSRYSSPKLQNQENLQEEVDPSEETPGGHEELNYQTLQATDDEEVPDEDEIMEPIEESETKVVFLNGRFSLTRRQCGILGAVLNGIMTGGSLIPLHYAAEEGVGGAKFFPSYGAGAMIANTIMWLLVFLVSYSTNVLHGKSIQQTLDELPKLHLRVLWLPGLLAGLMLSLAMFTTILAITYLGQGVGNSIVQSKILVSGLWGIFWYKEVVGAKTVAKWFASAGICIIAIIWLSLERLKAKEAKN